MQKLESLKAICKENERISAKIIDEFLLYYASRKSNLEPEMNRRFSRFRHVTRKFQKELVNMLKAQYIAHKIFMEGGLISKYLNHSDLKRFNKEEMDFLKHQASHPWKFNFSAVIDQPGEDFFNMEDVFTGESFLLYSPGTKAILKSRQPKIWFNLINNNGACSQTYGPIGYYNSFEPDDIFFFATELDPDIEDEADLLESINQDPVPYMMLLSGADYPLSFQKEYQAVQVMAEFDLEKIETKALTDTFKTEYCEGFYRFSLKGMEGHPHFAQAYYNEKQKTMVLSALTDSGYQSLVEALKSHGYFFPDEPLLRVNPSMIVTAANILGEKIELNPYESLFTKKPSPSEKKETDKLNLLLSLALPDINAGREPDVEALARESGVDVETARDILRQISGKLKK